MLYGVHVFARAKVIPDLALSRGAEAYERARSIGDRQLEFLAAGGTALSYLRARRSGRGGRRGSIAQRPSPRRARRRRERGSWSYGAGCLHAARGDADGMRGHLERAVQMAAEQGLPAVRCEALADARARGGVPRRRAAMTRSCSRSPNALRRRRKELLPLLPGHAPWGARADAALATVALAREEPERAVEAARSRRWRPSGRAARRPGPRRAPARRRGDHGGRHRRGADGDPRPTSQLQAAVIANRIVDEEHPDPMVPRPGRKRARRASPRIRTCRSTRHAQDGSVEGLDDEDAQLLKLVVEGLSNEEIADRLDVDTE